MENSDLLEAIKQVFPEKTQIFNRFLKMVDFYGYSNKSLVDFLKLIINEPDKFKDMEHVVQKWKSPLAIKNMYSSLLKIYQVPAVKDLISVEKYDLVVNEIREFLKQAAESASAASKSSDEIVVIDKSQADLNTLRMRLSMYCDILDEIGGDNPGIVAIIKMMRYDIGNI